MRPGNFPLEYQYIHTGRQTLIMLTVKLEGKPVDKIRRRFSMAGGAGWRKSAVTVLCFP